MASGNRIEGPRKFTKDYFENTEKREPQDYRFAGEASRYGNGQTFSNDETQPYDGAQYEDARRTEVLRLQSAARNFIATCAT